MLSTGEANVPNYGCGRMDNLLALLDGAERAISIQMSTLGGTYKVPQMNLEIASEALSDKSQFPFFHQMNPKEGFQYPAIVHLLLHFRWTLIGLFASDTEKGENFMRTFPPVLVRSGICVVISQLFSTTGYTASLRDSLSKWRQVNVFVHFIEYVSIWERILPFHLTFMRLPGPIEGKVWILTTFLWYILKKRRLLKYIHSILNFAYLPKIRPKDSAFEPHFFVEEKFQDHYFLCSLSKNVFSVKSRRRCTQKAPLETQKKRNRKRAPNEYQYYSFMKTLAQALNAAYSSRSRRRRKEGEKSLGSPRLQPWQVWGSRYGSINLRSFGGGIQRRRRGTNSTDLANSITQGIIVPKSRYHGILILNSAHLKMLYSFLNEFLYLWVCDEHGGISPLFRPHCRWVCVQLNRQLNPPLLLQ
ncbi:probable metabotropic glutamate receptor mgl-1 [Pantherophis guttatus]|uniref:Probable metabotropic glutamate receptor mgl-1 n=1 Tax=Pantherophis guttatus TaxID=94885 RepID=A0ABM3Z1Q5_PANGU|nr:probable metabotropic glutamate receptor mgl-1 [Pantherophis guttatus]